MRITVESHEVGFNPYAFLTVPTDGVAKAIITGLNGRVFALVQGDADKTTKQLPIVRLATGQAVPTDMAYAYVGSAFDGTYFWHYYQGK